MYKILYKKFKTKERDKKDFYDNMNNDLFDLSLSQTELDIFLDTPVLQTELSITVLVDLEMFLKSGLSKIIINDFVCSSILNVPYKQYQTYQEDDEDEYEDDIVDDIVDEDDIIDEDYKIFYQEKKSKMYNLYH